MKKGNVCSPINDHSKNKQGELFNTTENRTGLCTLESLIIILYIVHETINQTGAQQVLIIWPF